MSGSSQPRGQHPPQDLASAWQPFARLPVALHAHDNQGQIRWLNRAAIDCLGRSEAECLGRPFWEFHTEPAPLRQAHHHCVAGATHVDLPSRVVGPDGGHLPVHLTLMPPSATSPQGCCLAYLTPVAAEPAAIAAILRVTVDPLLIIDAQGHLAEINAAAEEVFGWPRAELLGCSAQVLLPENRRSHSGRALTGASGQDGIQHLEMPLQRRDGSSFIAELVVSPFLSMGATHHAVQVRDVGTSRRVAQELREKAERLRWLIETTSEAVFRFELQQPLPLDLSEDDQLDRIYRDGYLADANAAMARMHGFPSAQSMIGIGLQHVLPREDRRNQALLRGFIRSGYRLLDAESVDVDDQGVAHHRLNCLYGEIQDGWGYRAWGTSRDITNHTNAELSRREDEQRLRAAIQAAEVGVWDFDALTGTARCSERAREILSIPSDVVLGREFLLHAIHPDDRQRTQRSLHRCLESDAGGEVVLEYRVQRDQDHPRWVAVRGKASFSEHGGLIRFTGAVLDITARKSIQQALQDKTRELERANSELERSNLELEQFAYIASHDLQEPLRMVVNYLGLLQRRFAASLDPKALEFVREAADGARRMQALVRGLLEYSRADAHHAPVSIAADQSLDIALANLAGRISASGATLVRTGLPQVLADPVLLGQVFQNLISNGIKFCKDHPIITVRGETRDTDCLLCVQDNGIGIDPAQQGHLFQLFRRLHTRDEYPGTGIGLALVRKIIERHGGRVWLESQPDHGTTVLFTLPRSSAAGP